MTVKVMTIFGTRPEAVKVAPVLLALQTHPDFDPIVVSTGQHKEMLAQVNGHFGIKPQIDLAVMRPGQSLTGLAARVLDGLQAVFDAHQPDAVLVQGDTTTVMAAAIAAFYNQIPVAHLEAGLRSGNLALPWPEEANRRLAGQVASLHLAPTPAAAANLRAEGVDPATITVTGNTGIDALEYTLAQPVNHHPQVAKILAGGQRIVLVTVHRRESWGAPLTAVGTALRHLAASYPQCAFVLPAHANPQVRSTLTAALQGPAGQIPANVHVTEPLPYPQFTKLLAAADLVLTDSGGIQEEAPSLGKPVLVLRETTERPEALTAGTVRLVGTESSEIIAQTSALLDDPAHYQQMAQAVNPYGDGKAAPRVVAALAQLLGIGQRLPDFSPHH